jgi:hypothetical protein
MFYPTQLDENTQVLIEAPASGALGKSDMEIRPDPLRALLNCQDLVGKIARGFATSVGNALDGTGMDFEVEFAVRADAYGSVMISQHTGEGQFICRIKYSGDSNSHL